METWRSVGCDIRQVLFFWVSLILLAFVVPRVASISYGNFSIRNFSPPLLELDFSQTRDAIETKLTLLDARPEKDYHAGHLPTAISLSRHDFERVFPTVQSHLNRSKLVIVYCSGLECDDAEIVARELLKRGFSKVAVYRGGWEEWQENTGR